MKKQNNYLWLSLLLGLTIFLFQCKKDDESNEPDSIITNNDVISTIKGTISVPENTDITALTIASSYKETSISKDGYEIEMEQKYTSNFVLNKKGEAILMGYYYPGNNDNAITARSTALAMLMSTPSILLLSDEGKQEMINYYTNDPDFDNLVSEVEKIAALGRSLFDKENTNLHDAFEKVITNLNSNLRKASSTTLPVTMNRYGKNMIFNNTHTINTVIGVYKDDKRIDKILLEGQTYFPTSIFDLVKALETETELKDYNYSLGTDGKYVLKFRTGKPGADDGSPEYKEAFNENLFSFSVNLLSAVLPYHKAEGNLKCMTEVANQTVSTFHTVMDMNSKSITISQILIFVSENTLTSVSSLSDCYKKTPSNWFKNLGKAIGWIGKVGTGTNTVLFATDWGITNESVDSCFNVSGSVVSSCDGGTVSTVSDIDGNVYKTVIIGTQEWMAENLKTTKYSDGTSIPLVISNDTWASNHENVITMMCYYDNSTANKETYGALYNFYVVNTGKVCPSGWHVPSDAEWKTLTNYVGQSEGTKLKSKTGWNENGNGTDVYGFSGIPGGRRNYKGYFTNIGSDGVWWSSTTAYNTYDAWSHSLYYYNSSLSKTANYKSSGLSVRCVRD